MMFSLKPQYLRREIRFWFLSRPRHFVIDRSRFVRILALIVAATLSSACVVSNFRGDGKLVDYGPFAARHRYVLDLGPVDLGRTGKYTYTMSNLPSVDFVIGLEIVEAQANQFTGNQPAHSGSIRLLLETSNHEIVISEDGPLESWIWSFAKGNFESFLYRTGKEHWITNKDGTTSPVPDGTRTDEGWGTYFLPRPDITYRLTLEVLEAQALPRPTRLLVTGGGWK